ncbi:hypothetical protein OIU84_001316 [Salix udensis]|uniref:Sey1/RHD3-like three-helix bundle domain-containing protein n=1 Tax=Salix udensis TaxID=889485 RepID=A0AAD6K6S9_9ROSI|nr:hypothetical protein OIU84_001316 [Salix udensis]
MATIRFNDMPDEIEKVFFSDREVPDTWEEVSPEATILLKPANSKSLWKKFRKEIKPMVTRARSRQKQVTDVLADEVQSLFEGGEADTWVSVRNLLASRTDVAESELSNAHVDFELPRSEIDTKLGYLKVYARRVLERKARESAATERVLMPMKHRWSSLLIAAPFLLLSILFPIPFSVHQSFGTHARFTQVFNLDENSTPRVWTPEQNIDEIERNALSASLKILAVMAAIRLDNREDQIEIVLSSSLMGAVPAEADAPDPLASNTWEENMRHAGFPKRYAAYTRAVQVTVDAEALRQAKKVIKQILGLVAFAIMTLLSAYWAMGTASNPEVAAGLRNVGQAMVHLMKDIGPEVLAILKDELPKALSFLGPQMVAVIMALFTNMTARWQR